MRTSDPDVENGAQPKLRTWRAITQRALNLFAANVTIIASQPFFKNGKWSVLYGDRRHYHIREYPDARAAWREFRAIENAVLRDFGFPSCDFHLLESEVAAQIVDVESYRAAVSSDGGA